MLNTLKEEDNKTIKNLEFISRIIFRNTWRRALLPVSMALLSDLHQGRAWKDRGGGVRAISAAWHCCCCCDRGCHRSTESCVGARGATGCKACRGAVRPMTPIPVALAPSPPQPLRKSCSRRRHTAVPSPTPHRYTYRRHRGVLNGSHLAESGDR